MIGRGIGLRRHTDQSLRNSKLFLSSRSLWNLWSTRDEFQGSLISSIDLKDNTIIDGIVCYEVKVVRQRRDLELATLNRSLQVIDGNPRFCIDRIIDPLI